MDETTRNAIAALALAVLLGLAALIVWPFAPALAWAAIVAYATWPLRCRIARWVPTATLPAALMTLAVIAGVAIPVSMLSLALQREIGAAVEALRGDSPIERVFAALHALPWLGKPLADSLRSLLQSPGEAAQQALEWLRDRAGGVFVLAGDLGRNVMTLLLMFLTLFFIYRDGQGWMIRLRQVMQQLFGDEGRVYLATVRTSTRAVVYGLLATVLAQGSLAGIGFWAAGVPAPTLMALAAALFALLPFGPAVPIGAAVLWLALSGSIIAAIGLALWGVFVVGMIDNLLRPLVMASGLQLHYLVAFFGVLGGVMLFGLIGVFVGPIVLAIVASLTRKWLDDRAQRNSGRRAAG